MGAMWCSGDLRLVGGAVKLAGEATGSDTIEGAATRTADEISPQLKVTAQEQGWI